MKPKPATFSLNSLLKAYEGSGYILQLRARFLFFLCIASILATFFVLLKAVYGYSVHRMHGPLPVPVIAAGLMVYCLCFVFLVRGYYFLSANIILVMVMGIVWSALFSSHEVLVLRINAIGYALAALTMVPLLIPRWRYLHFIYAAVSAALLAVFAVTNQNAIGLHGIDLADFIVDFSASILIIGFVGFYIFSVNKTAISRAEAELKERKEAEAALVKSERKYREMADLMPQIIFESDAGGNITYVNQAGLRKMGFSEDDVSKGVNMTSLIAAEDTERLQSNIRRRLSGEAGAGVRYTAIGKNGKAFPVEAYTTPIIEEGRAVGMRGIIVDIGERIRAEEDLRHSEERLRSIAENLPGAVFQISVDGELNTVVNYVSDQAREVFGIEIHPLDTFFERGTKWIHPDDMKSWYGSFSNAVHNRASWDFEGRYRHPDGQEIWLRIIGHPDCGKDVIVFNGIALDVTDRKKAEIRLRESEELFKTMVESNPNPVSLSGMDGRLILVNDAFSRITGIPKEIITGKTMDDLDLRNIQLEYEKLWNELLTKGHVDNYEVSLSDKNGQISHQLIFLRMVTVKGSPAVLSSSIDITGIKKLESRLRESENLYRSIIDKIPYPVTIANMKNEYMFANRVYLETYNLRLEDIIGKTAFDVGFMLDPEIFESITDKSGHEGRVLDFEAAMTVPGNRKIHALISSDKMVINDVPCAIVTIVDISDRKRLENRLKESEDLYRSMINKIPYPVSIVDMENRYLFANSAYLEDFHLTLGEIIGKTSPEVGFALNSETVQLMTSRIIRDGRFINIEAEITVPGEENIFALISGDMMAINGSPCVIVTTVDISERKKLENRLKESENLFRAMVDMVPYSIVITDIDRNYTFANRAYFENYHLQLTDVIGKSPDEIGFEIDEDNMKIIHNELKEKGRVLNVEIQLTVPKNHKIYALISAETVIINGKPHVVTTIVDISERKALENKLKEYTQGLELIVEDRTKDLQAANEELHATVDELHLQRQELEIALARLKEAQDQMIQSEKMATLGILTAGVAHEINNPVNYIFNGVIAMEKYLEEHVPGHMENMMPLLAAINTGIARTIDIVKSLNRYSRKDNLSFFQCNVHEILDNCLTMLLNQYRNRIQIVRDYAGGMPKITAAEGRLQQAFVNILTNAIQAIEGKGEITITTRSADGSVEISIADTGAGISEEDMKHIYDPFFTTRPPGKGTGLGLSIVHTIIQEHRGAIRCSSRPGEGTIFTINLPADHTV